MKLGHFLLVIIIILLFILIFRTLANRKSNTMSCLRFIKKKPEEYKPKKCTETDDDDYDCSRIELDEYIIHLNTFFNSLRCLEYSNPLSQSNISKRQYREARKIFIRLYRKIFESNERNSLSYLGEFSRELYQRSIYYYQFLNEHQRVSGIPVFNYVKNNDCLLPLLEKKIKAPMLHFDTHSDHKEFENFEEYHQAIHQEPMNIEKIRQLAYDIGCFSSYYIYYSKTNFIWINPLWSLDSPEYSRVTTKMTKHPEHDEIVHTPTTEEDPESYIYVRGKLKDNFSKLTQDLDDNFILSIDLDYFCTNGLLEEDIIHKKSKSEVTDILADADPASYGRTRYQIEFTNPFYNYSEQDEDYLQKRKSHSLYLRKLKNELKLVTQRLQLFKKFLLYIKNERKINPISILISDSCNVHLSRDANSISLTNDFCPQNLVLWIRHQLFIILQQVYSSKVIPYLEWSK